MKVAITGGTGFLGINLIQQMAELGWHIIVLHRYSSDLSDLQQFSIEFIEVDFSNKASLIAAIPEGLDAIFHAAGDTNLWSYNNDRQYHTNVTVTEWLVDIAIEKRVRRFIHTSSISAYGFHNETIHEQSERRALTSGVNYLKTKYLGEMAVKRAVHTRGLDAVILNPCAIMGPYDRHNWSQLFIMISDNTLPGIPPGEGSYCHVRSVAQAHINAVLRGRTGANYILAGADCSFEHVIDKIGTLLRTDVRARVVPAWLLQTLGHVHAWRAAITKREPRMTPEKALMVTKRVIASSERAKAELDYNADVSIDAMLQDCYDWLKSEHIV